MDRQWIQWGSDSNYRFTSAYKEGINYFLQVAEHHLNANNQIKCPCMKCNNTSTHTLNVVRIHLLKSGMVTTYNPWIHHGEHNEVHDQAIPNSPVAEQNEGIFDRLHDLLPWATENNMSDRVDIEDDVDDDICL